MGGRLFGGADHGQQDVGLERRARTLAQAVSGSVGSQSTATNVPALRVGTDRSWRAQERSADGEAACARRMRSIASLHCGRGLGRNACGNRTTCPSRQAGRRQRCRAGDRRYCDTQERHAFGWCRCAICVSAGQDRELPDPGIADAGARRSAGRTGVAVVSSRELDEQAVSVGASGCSGRMSNGTNETGNGSGGDRSCDRGRCALWLRVGGCRLWAERAVPSGAHSSQACLGSRYSAAPQGVPCRSWLIGEHRMSGEKKYYLANLPAKTDLRTSATTIKARWVCEQAHQQMKEELGLDHFEGRSWQGLHRHALMTMIAYAFLQVRRLAPARREKKNQRAAASANFARRTPRHPRTLRSTTAAAMPALSKMDLQRAAA